MKKYNIVFFGTPKIGATVLKRLIEMDCVDVKLVVTQPDRMVGRKKVLTPTPVKELAIENSLNVIQPEKVGLAYDEILNTEPDFLITCAYGQFVPTKILEIPTIDAINLHGSLLPKYRGGAPIQYAIKNGDSKTGISIMKMVKKMDAGDYYVQEEITISDEDDSGLLFEKMANLAANMIEKCLDDIGTGKLKPIPQNEDEVTFAYNISSEQEKIDWSMTNREVFNLIRSLSPSPISHTFANGERYKIKKSLAISDQNITNNPGEIIKIDNDGILVQTGKGTILIKEIQRFGKKMVEASLYKKNNLQDLKEGDIFENKF